MFFECRISEFSLNDEALLTELLFAEGALSVTNIDQSLTALFNEEIDLSISYPYTWKTIKNDDWMSTTDVSFNNITLTCDNTVFGDGNHPTTQLCCSLLSDLIDTYPSPKSLSFVDCGTGSGLLSILAWEKDLRHISAFDIDENAVKNAQRNGQKLGLPTSIFTQQDICEWNVKEPVTIIVCNVLTSLILSQLSKLKASLIPNGHLLLSGIGIQWQKDIEEALQDHQLTIIKCEEKDGWLAYHCTLSENFKKPNSVNR